MLPDPMFFLFGKSIKNSSSGRGWGLQGTQRLSTTAFHSVDKAIYARRRRCAKSQMRSHGHSRGHRGATRSITKHKLWENCSGFRAADVELRKNQITPVIVPVK